MKDLYKKLAEIEPTRFRWREGDSSGWSLHTDNPYTTVWDSPSVSMPWLDKTLAQEGVTRIDRAEGQSWEEAMLQALVDAVERRVKG